MSFLPLLIFMAISLYISYHNIPDVKGMWAGTVIGLLVTLFFAKDKEFYAEKIIDGLANRLVLLSVACWLFAGILASVLQGAGLVKGLIWLAYSLGARGTYFVLVSFLASAIFATATGTGLGTIIAGMMVLYPAGLLLGSAPALLVGSIIGGGALGDNLAAISDTTICSAATQGADIAGVVKSRLKYTLLAAGITIVLIFINSKGTGLDLNGQEEIITSYMEAKGLIMLLPAFLTILLAWRGCHIIPAVTAGIVSALALGKIFGLLSLGQLLTCTGGQVGGIIIEGLSSVVEISVLAILIMACVSIMQAGGGDEKLLNFLDRLVKNPREAEFLIILLVLFFTTIMGLNTPSVLAAGITVVAPLGERFKLHPYRRANLLDASACTLVYILPWAPTMLLAQSLSKSSSLGLISRGEMLTAKAIIPHTYYCYVLLAIMLFSVWTGWGRKFSDE